MSLTYAPPPPRTAEGDASPPPSPARPTRTGLVLGGLACGLGVMFLLAMAIGSVWIDPMQIIAVLTGGDLEREAWRAIVLDVRLPRTLTAVLAGAALGVAGLQMQTLFRNPLADPFVLGISAGASLGVALVVLVGGAATAGVFGSSLGFAGDLAITAAAIIGASVVLALVLLVSSRVTSPATVLILGLMFSYAVSAFVTVLVAQANVQQLERWVAWGFGSFSGVTWDKFEIFAPVVLVGIALAAATTKQLNALLLGEHYARSMGLNVRRARLLTMLGASLLGGVVTAFCGPIAFLGIAIPHLCRGLLGTSDHRVLMPAVVLMGGVVALFAQLVALMPGQPGILPLNSVTALIGAPIVVIVLLRNRRGVFTG